MYPGPMHKIAYVYRTADNYTGNHAVYGQVSSENYYDGTNVGAAVTTLTVPTATTRTETRADNKTRTFIYTAGGYVTWVSDFMSHQSTQGYDTYKYVNSVIDFNRKETDYTSNTLTGNVTQVQFPATADVTPSPAPGGTVSYTYGWGGCVDPNNRDATNPYFLCTATDEGGHVTKLWRDSNKRVTRIDYPDSGYELFSYDSSHFYQLSSHRMVTGGTESFTYNGRAGLKDTYRNPSNASGNPTARYQYDAYDRVSDVTDVLGSLGDPDHTTSFTYNLRGQLSVTTLPTNPIDGVQHRITSWYNPDGTMSARQNELYQTANYTYDDYRRLTSVTPPDRGDGTGLHATYLYYDANGTGPDYTFTDSNVRWVILASGKTIKTTYDDNRRKSAVTMGYNTGDAATTSYTYDGVGNPIKIVAPNQQPGQPYANQSTQMAYDERNRPSSVTDALSRTTSFKYDTAGRKKTITRPNGQVMTNVNFDEMNRLLQQNVSQTPEPVAVTNYTYYPSGLLHTMQDPHLNGTNDQYTYAYDLMGRKHIVTYPAEPVTGVHRTEVFSYDAAGRLYQYITRGSKTQTFAYDALNRMTDFNWNDGSTPSVHFTYDAASRLTGITNKNASNVTIADISRAYWNDNLPRSETETITGGVARQVSYTYDADGNRGTLSVPGYSFTYDYTNRNQVRTITDNGSNITSSFWYDKNGNVVQRNPGNGTTSSYTSDALDRATQIVHTLLNGSTRTFNYGYYPTSNDRKWTQRLIVPNSVEHNKGEVFSYDLADQATAVQLDIANPNTADPGNPTIIYDSNGNRIWYAPPGINKHYDPPYGIASNLSQYTSVIINGSQYNLTYRADANLAHYDDNNATYNYDAQNRLTSATVGGVTMSFAYDGLNRQVSRTMGNNTTFSNWDGWNLVEDYHGNGVPDATYLYGPTGLVKNLRTNNYYYQDGSGSTSHLANSGGALLEWYRYDLDGTPFFYNSSDQMVGGSNAGVRHLFTGQQWYSELGLYDLRNRFYSPDIGRFLQPDPIDFDGDPTNLYRYCGNNPVRYSDPSGEIPLVGTIFGVVTGGVAGGISGYSQGGWGGAALGAVTGGVVGGVIGTVFEPGAPGAGAVAASALVGASASYLGQVLGNASGHVVQGQSPQASDLTNVNPGMIIGAGIGGAASPFIKAGGAALFGTGYAGRALTSIFDGFVGGTSETLGGVVYTRATSWSYFDGQRVVVVGTPVDNISSTANYFGGRAGLTGGGSAWPTIIGSQSGNGWNPSNYAYGFAPWGYGQGVGWGNLGGWNVGLASIDARNAGLAFAGNLAGQGLVSPFQGGDIPGFMECFVAGTPVLMADGSEKPIESIQVGEAVLAWNEETKQIFATKVVSALHHEEKMQILLDIQLEDGRSLTVNNDHPMYVMEDGDFTFTDEIAARFAKGKTVTFLDSKNNPVKIASLGMRSKICKMYNLHVEGQGKKGHTYYASGILVHNSGAGYRHK
jgi:RHS repeat-associated protein